MNIYAFVFRLSLDSKDLSHCLKLDNGLAGVETVQVCVNSWEGYSFNSVGVTVRKVASKLGWNYISNWQRKPRSEVVVKLSSENVFGL